MKNNIFYSLNKFFLAFITLLYLQSCNKKNEIDTTTGEVTINISPSVSNFSDGGIKGRASIKEQEQLTNSLEFSKDLIMVSTLMPISESISHTNTHVSNGVSNRANLSTTNLDIGEVYKLIIYNSNGSFRTFRNYKYGSPEVTHPLSLPINQSYTFIAYSLNSTQFEDLDNVFPDSTVTLSQAKIIIENNPDLLVYKDQLSVDATNSNLAIIFKHQFNEITTIIDASASGYSIDPSSLETRFNIAKNIATLSFNDMTQINSASGGFVANLNGTTAYNFTTANSIPNSIATSKTTTLINTDKNTNLFSVRNIKIGSVTNSIINPFSNGVTLIPGYKYRLEVKIIPRDKTFIYENKPAVLLGGQVWMRYSLGSPGDLNNSNGDNADTPGSNIHGAYYQWGKKLPGINANSTNTNTNWDRYGIAGNVASNYFTRWNSGSETSPIKGTEDPCPTGFRLPIKKDFETLLGYIENDFRTFNTSSYNTVNYALQLTSKYNANAKLTFAASGYGYQGNDNGNYDVGFGGLLARYTQVHLKTSFHGTPNLVTSSGSPDGKAYQTSYMLYSPVDGSTGTNRIITYPTGGRRVSASVNAHTVRCIAISSAAAIAKMNEREIHSGGDKNIDF